MNLVTGATGIVGSHVVLALLQKGEGVVACRQKNSDLSKVEDLFSFYTSDHKTLFSRIRWVEVDICDIYSLEDALEGISNVYHCAGFVSFNPGDRKKMFAINETGTKNVVDACLQKKIPALCHVSSIATVNNLDYTLALNEEIFWKKSGKESDYAISKYNAEREVWRGVEEGLKAVIVNPGVIISPGFWGQSSSRIFEAAYKGNKFYTDGTAAYIAASDVAKSMVELVAAKKFGQRYILVENNYKFKDILGHMQSNFNKARPSIKASRFMMVFARYMEGIVTLFTGKERKITKALIHSAFNTQLYSSEKIKKELHIAFMPVHQAIEQVCKKYQPEKRKTKTTV